MRKINLLLGLFIVMALMLTACDGLAIDETSDGTDPAVQETEDAFVNETETTDMEETPVVPTTGLVDRSQVSNLLDYDVVNVDNEEIGQVNNLILNIDDQQIDYVIIEVGGFLGIGAKQVAVPYERLVMPNVNQTTDAVLEEDGDETQADQDETPVVETQEDFNDQTVFVLDVTEEELNNAPEFDQDAFPGIGDPFAEDWDSEYQNFWEGDMTAPTGEDETDTPDADVTATPEDDTAETEEVETEEEGTAVEGLQGVMLATEMLGLDIRDEEDNDLATIEDVIIDPQSGQIRYMLLDVTGIEGLEDQQMLVPLDAVPLSYDSENDNIIMAGDPQVLIDSATSPEAGYTPEDLVVASVDYGWVTNLNEFEVIDANDENIGEVDDVLLNFDDQQVEYVVIQVGGILGIGGRQVAVPFDHLMLPDDAYANEEEAQDEDVQDDEVIGPENIAREQLIYLDVTQEDLENAPEFDQDALPNLGEPVTEGWDDDYRSFWDEGVVVETEEEDTTQTQTPEAETEDDEANMGNLQGIVLASEVLGMEIKDQEDDTLATVENIIIDPQSGEIRYLLLDITGIEGLEDQQMFIPVNVDFWSYDRENNLLVVTADQQALASAPTFQAGLLPDTTGSEWNIEIDAYWDNINQN